jgi:hypothetical protein
MSSAIPEPSPDPYVEESWFQRPAFLATSALIVVLVGAALWFLGRESNSESETSLPAPTVAVDTEATQPTPTVRSEPTSSGAADSSTTPTATIRPSRIPRSAGVPGAPVPSTTVPPRSSTSSIGLSSRNGRLGTRRTCHGM